MSKELDKLISGLSDKVRPRIELISQWVLSGITWQQLVSFEKDLIDTAPLYEENKLLWGELHHATTEALTILQSQKPEVFSMVRLFHMIVTHPDTGVGLIDQLKEMSSNNDNLVNFPESDIKELMIRYRNTQSYLSSGER